MVKKGAFMNTPDKDQTIRTTLENLRTSLQSHGGDLELVDIEGNIVRLRLQGACSGCPHAAMTIKQGIEQTLQTEVDPALTVERVE